MTDRHCSKLANPIVSGCMQPALRIEACCAPRKMSTPNGSCRHRPARRSASASRASDRSIAQQPSFGRQSSNTLAVVRIARACLRGMSSSHSSVE